MKLFARPVVAVAVLAALGTGLAPAGPAFAAGPDEPTTGGDVDDGSFVQDAQADLKDKIVANWTAVAAGNSLADKAQLKTNKAQLESDVDAYAAQYGMDALTGRDPKSSKAALTSAQFVNEAAAIVHPPSRTLALKQFAQVKDFYCGPATMFMIMGYKAINTSRYAADRVALTQANTARSTYLKTEANGATRFSLNVMAPAMNKWRENKPVGFYGQHAAAKMIPLADIMKYSTYQNMPNAIGTVEAANSARYNNHGSKSKVIGHWIVGYGYGHSGNYTYMADPATSVWNGVVPKFSHATNAFQTNFIKAHGNGIVY